MGKEILGETHCDTIGDIFKNKHIQRFLMHWFAIKFPGKKLRISTQKNSFSKEFYNFIRDIFSDIDALEDFLSEIRAKFLLDKKYKKHLQKKYDTDDFIIVLLTFFELYYELEEGTRYTVSGVFSKRIIEILENQTSMLAHNEDSNEGIYESISVHESLKRALKEDIIPITQEGEIIGIIHRLGEKKSYLAVSLLEKSLFEVDKRGKVKEEVGVFRKDLLKKITKLKKILDYYHSTDSECNLSKQEQVLYENLTDEYNIQTESGKISSFETFLRDKIQSYQDQFSIASCRDLTRVNELKKLGVLNPEGGPILNVISYEGNHISPGDVTSKTRVTSLKIITANI